MELAARERRSSRDQAALLVIEALAQRKLVSADGLNRGEKRKFRVDAEFARPPAEET
jgi:hypothetical protein